MYAVARFYSEVPSDQRLKNRYESPRAAWQFSHTSRGARLNTARFATASISHLSQPMTMLRLKSTQRRVLADKLPDAGNVVGGGLLVGQAISGQMFSAAFVLIGIALWAGFIAAALAFAAERDHS
jgi:hypothetical protein